MKTDFDPELRCRLDLDFKTEVWPLLKAVLKCRLRSVLNCDLKDEFTPEVTPMLITQLLTGIPREAHPYLIKSLPDS